MTAVQELSKKTYFTIDEAALWNQHM